ncbi:MAG: CoA ester lyase [Gammaproteobacteria bacterium]|nr:CoA ester lyase [Gammaproteobacteria bacterium]
MQYPTKLFKCLLFVAANEPDDFHSPKEHGATGIIVDLEDLIATQYKNDARKLCSNYFIKKTDNNFCKILRINSIKTHDGLEDILWLSKLQLKPDAVMLPKVESAAEVEVYNKLLPDLPLIALMESPKSLENATEIAAHPAIVALGLGGADLSLNMNINYPNWESMLWARGRVVQAATMWKKIALDLPYYLKLDDDSVLEVLEEAKRCKEMGFSGKLCIDLKHINPIMKIFTLTKEEINWARKVIIAFEQSHGNALLLDGKAIDKPIAENAKRILEDNGILE